jgi:hypothetical protein
MNTYSRILAALLLASASGGYVACGDSDNKKPDAEEKDAGEDGDEEDGGGDEEDAGKTDAGTKPGSDAGSTQEEAPKELDKCPDHPNVTTTGSFCTISAPLGNEVKTDLELGPVKGKMGYLISKSVFVGEDVGGKATADASKKKVTLTINKGTTLYGADSLSFLLVNRGSKLIAEGSAKYPIVFTSGASGANRPGRWGGVILNGRAPSNRADANGDVVGEAGTGKYSGPDADDNSGVVKYVRIEFSGGKIDDKNELNGLALQGVGKGTTIDYLHVHAGDDDGVEFFGGTVDAKHIIVTAFADDGIDWTDGWNGRVQFAIAQQWKYTNPGTGSNDASNGIEADNNDVNVKATPISEPTLSNVTLIGAPDMTAPAGGNGMNLRRATKGHLNSFVVLNFKTSCITLRGTDSAGFVGTGLTMETSGAFCPTMYEPAPGRSNDADPAAAEKLFGENTKFANADEALQDPYAQTASPDFRAKAKALLSGGTTPSDTFFEKVSYIGALDDSEDNWTKGNWFKITPFDQ